MRKLIFGLLGFATLGFGALSVQPAEAQPYYPGYGYRGPAVEYRYGRPAPVVRVQYGRPYREYRRPYRGYRAYPAYRPIRAPRRCWVERQRVWTNYGWVRRPVQVCRTVGRPGYRW